MSSRDERLRDLFYTPPKVKRGKLHLGRDCRVGTGVVVEAAEEVVFGDRCVIPDHAYLSGRRIDVGDDFYGYSWEGQRLDVGRGRTEDEHAVLEVGNRCTFHANKIDLAVTVTVYDDVGLSPEVTIYTHGYWMNPMDGFPCEYRPVTIGTGSIIGYRSVLLPGANVLPLAVVGAQSVVTGLLTPAASVFAGNPAKWIKHVVKPPIEARVLFFSDLLVRYAGTRIYRGLEPIPITSHFPVVKGEGWTLNVEESIFAGDESPDTDDLREFLFKRGVRCYTKRPFRKLPKV